MSNSDFTKFMIARGLKQLLETKSFTDVTVGDIARHCKMSRNTFYYHFKDKYDVINWIFYTDFISLVSAGNFENGWELLVAVGELFYRDQQFYRSALKIEGQNSFKDYFYESMTPIVSFFLRSDGEEEENGDREIL